MLTNCYDVCIHVKCVPGENEEAICQELADVIIDLDNLPYDFEVEVNKVGKIL